MEKEINLKNLFNVIRRRFWIIALLTMCITLVGGIYSVFLKTPLYASSARIMIQANPEDMNTLQVIIKEPVVLEKVAQEMNLKRSAGALSGQINVQNIQGSQIVVITVMDADPALAAKIANTTANVYKREVATIMNFTGVKVLTEAKVQAHPFPVNRNHTKTIGTAFMIGLILSIGLVFLLDSLDDTIKSEHNIEKLLDIPVLGSVSKMNRKNITNGESGTESTIPGGEPIGL